MKEGLHPKYEQTTVKCACGATIETGSTKKDLRVDITRSLQVSRSLLIPADVLTGSTSASILQRINNSATQN